MQRNDDAAYYRKRVADLRAKAATAASAESRRWAEKQLEGETVMLAQREREAGAAEYGREDEGTDAEVSAAAAAATAATSQSYLTPRQSTARRRRPVV